MFLQLNSFHILAIYTSEPNHEKNARELAKNGLKVYFAAPYSSWQKGAIENGNGLIRPYIPKSTQFSCISHQKNKQIMEKINVRAREKQNSLYPNECFYGKIISMSTCLLNPQDGEFDTFFKNSFVKR